MRVRGSRALRNTAVIPNLITLGNAVCGFGAISFIAGFDPGQEDTYSKLGMAAWLIMAGMVFDVFDGRVARMTGSTSDLGAQLDSLADMITFGLAPALLMVAVNHTVVDPTGPWAKMAWLFGLAYFLGAMLRLARFNVEADESEEAHQCFKGMPTPAAAGTIAGLVIVYFWLSTWKSWELQGLTELRPEWVEIVGSVIARTLPFFAFMSGYAMVSNKLIYPHVASLLFNRKQSFDTLVFVVFGVVLILVMIEPFLCLAFVLYMLWAPGRYLYAVAMGKPRPTMPEPAVEPPHET